MRFSCFKKLFGSSKADKITVSSVESMTLSLHGMRGSVVYILEGEGESPELCRYRELYRDGQKELIPQKSVKFPRQAIVELMNTCSVIRWNGFHGKHPKNVSDGIMFRFEAAVNGGVTVNADGSANFPDGYGEFVRTLDEMLSHG